MTRRTTLLVASASVLLLTGCASFGSDTSGQQTPYVTSEGTTSAPAATPTEPVASEPPSPFDATPVSTESADITTDDGYKAALTVEWLPAVAMTTSELPATCATALGLWGYQPSWTDAEVSITAVPVRITAEYPEVNGFTWPERSMISGSLAYNKPGLDREAMSGCVDGVQATDIQLPSSGVGGGPVEAYAVFFEPKTPNNADGVVDLSMGQLRFETVAGYNWSCGPDSSRSCLFRHP